MKRLSLYLIILLGGFLLIGAPGCSGDPNVEGAKLDLNNKDYDRALQNIGKALETNPDNAEAYLVKGHILREQAFAARDAEQHKNIFSEMITAYNRARELDPTQGAEVTKNFNTAYFLEFNRGIEAFNRAQGAENGDAEFSNAASYFGNAAMIYPDSSGAYINQAFALMNSGKATDAIGPLEMALEKGDTSEETYIYLAGLYAEQERMDRVVAILEQARGVHPGSEEVETQLMNAYVVSGQTDRALTVYQQAIARDPSNKLYHYNLGSLCLEMSNFECAVEHLQHAIELDSEYANALYNLGAAHVNQAVEVNSRVQALDDELREKREELSQAEIAQREKQIDDLVNQRREFFSEAVGPLEKAKQATEAEGGDLEGICQALYQAYAQTNQVEKAEMVADCAGYDL